MGAVRAETPEQAQQVEPNWAGLSTSALAGFTLLHLVLITQSQLKFEEAYYWDYSQHPALSYFDHPPFVAWMIGLSTRLLGNSPFAVRLPATLAFAVTSWLLFDLARQLFSPKAGFLTLLLLNLVPAMMIHSLIILPDSPLLLCWSLGMWCGWRLVSKEHTAWWWGVGVATGLGMDGKYPAIMIPFGIMLFCLLTGRRKLVWTPSMFGAAGLALLLFSPVIVWNISNDFASFRFQGGERMGQANGLGEKLSSYLIQFGFLSPSVFVALGASLVWGWRRRGEAHFAYLLSWCLPFLALLVYVSTRRLVQLNWPLPAYPASVVLMSGWLSSITRSRVFQATFWIFPLSFCGLICSALVLPWGVANGADDVHEWKPLGEKALLLRSSMPRPEQTFLVGIGYQSAAELAFTTQLPHLTLSNNALGERTVGFNFWEQPKDFLGWDAVVANYAQPRATSRAGEAGGEHDLDQTMEAAGPRVEWKERVPLDPQLLSAVFARVEETEALVVVRGGQPLRRYRFYRCFNYRGPGI